MLASAISAFASNTRSASCNTKLAEDIPARTSAAPAGSTLMQQVMRLSGRARDAVVKEQVLAGNVPSFLRNLSPVTFTGKQADGQAVQVVICVLPDYLAVGSDRDFVRIPMGLPTAAEIADRFGFFLPTPKMVDAIYAQAKVRLVASPMPANDRMRSTAYLLQHNRTVETQLATFSVPAKDLTAGEKKDVVFSLRLRAHPGKVAIYGWQRGNGRPIQPLSTVHGAEYADYSHGIRLVSGTAYVDGAPQPLADVMQDSRLAQIVSSEGPIANAQALLTSLYQ
ncbi:hypothetical protein [Pseudooceanicola sp.]|uniref:hypothetical protein n=1 Tax=Pseudooceanicola sp. TaxID=1914328 RepID=UPI0026265BDB|nr:hypothetical protein [Pseudooceanicola sp.]MDF1855906.1 hypothetical protein [Pseudooceanicola sp.]